jgi:membrane protein YqaA with SNARE-associated domain
MFMRRGLLKNEARLYAPSISAAEILQAAPALAVPILEQHECRPSPPPAAWPHHDLMPHWLTTLLTVLALPEYGLSTLFVAAFISATLIPVGSEPALYGLLRLNPDLFWSAVFVATAGNTLGGAVDWWMGWEAHKVVDKYRHSRAHVKAIEWLERLGPKACLLAWLPIIGDPLCAVAGWLKMPFWPCLAYMAVGKFLRYLIMTMALLNYFPW